MGSVTVRVRLFAILRERAPSKAEREHEKRNRGFPAYTTSAGWLGYSDDKLRRLCQEAVDAGYQHVKLKVGANLTEDIRRLTIAREVLGPDRALMIDANQLWDQTLFTVDGLPAGTPVRIATLDAYTGTVWAAGEAVNQPGQQRNGFQRVGPRIVQPVTAGRPETTVRVTIEAAYAASDDVNPRMPGPRAATRSGAGAVEVGKRAARLLDDRKQGRVVPHLGARVDRRLDADLESLQLPSLGIDGCLHLGLGLAGLLAELRLQLLELGPGILGFARELLVEHLAGKPAERRGAQQAETSLDRGDPVLVDLCHDRRLARRQCCRDLVDDITVESRGEQVVEDAAGTADVGADRHADRTAQQPDQPAGHDADQGADRSTVRRLADVDAALGVPRLDQPVCQITAGSDEERA